MAGVLPPKLQVYGQLKFLTFQCLCIQILNTILHILAHFVKPLRSLRDLVFTCFASPVGSVVVYSFWAVWHLFGRESILPARLDPFYPTWLNHTTHTLCVPINFLLALSLHHKYTKNGTLLTLSYMVVYVAFLYLIKAQTGLFVYGYLNEMGDNERIVYFAGTGIFICTLYKLGQLVTYAIHGCSSKSKQPSYSTKSAVSKKQKQK